MQKTQHESWVFKLFLPNESMKNINPSDKDHVKSWPSVQLS